MYRMAFIMILSLMFTGVYGFSDVKDTSRNISECDSLRCQLDMLNAKLDKIMITLSDKNPTIKYDTKKWGKGWNVGASVYTIGFIGAEAGYMYKTRRGSFLGVSLGYNYISNNVDPFYRSFVELKLTAATPIIFNCLSFQAVFFPAYYSGTRHYFGESDEISQGAIGFGPQMAFWITPSSSLILGYTGTFSKFLSPNGGSIICGNGLKVGYTYTFTKR
jgi:hypothetical protein